MMIRPLLSSRDKASIGATIDGIANEYDHAIYAFYVLTETVCPDCGYDSFTRSAVDVDCSTCGGAGVIRTYASQQVIARVSFPRLSDFVLGVAGGIDVGDAILYVHRDTKPLIEKVAKDGYIIMDNDRYAVMTIDTAGPGSAYEYAVRISRQEQ